MTGDSAHTRWPLNGNVLVIDNDAAYRGIVALRLSACGCTCDTAATYDEALQRIVDDRIQIIVLGYTACGSDPPSLVDKIKGLRPDVCIVGHSVSNRRAEFLAMGVRRFLRKPLVVKDLVHLLPGTAAERGDGAPE